MISTIFNILAVCGAAGFAGVMLCIGLTLGGYWSSLPPADFLAWFAVNNRFVAISVPVIVLPTLIGLIGSLAVGWHSPDRLWWGLSTICIVIVLVLTVAYFVPTNTAFSSGTMSVNAVSDKLNQWIMLHYFRIGFAFLAAVFGCIAIRS